MSSLSQPSQDSNAELPDNEDEAMAALGAVGVEHSIPYNHHIDETPVGLMLGLVAFLPSAWSWPALLLAGLMFIAISVLYSQFFFSIFLAILILTGFTWVGATMFTQNTPVKANMYGLSFPVLFITSLNGILDRSWDELRDVNFIKDDMPSSTPDKMVLRFRDKARASFNLDGFTKKDLERLLLVINTYCPEARINPAPETMNLLQARDYSDILSFTSLWQAEMNNRFGSTAFVPLNCGDQLQGGSIKVLGQVAFGGLSAIYLAERNRVTVILKEAVLPESADKAAREKALELFQREAKLLARIDHPRIASVFDYFVENGRHYLILQHIEGKNLRAFINEFGPQPESTVLRWAFEIVALLEYLHELTPPVVHRDLTPENFIIGSDGTITLIDFGAANEFLGTATGTVVGKNAYIPIEQFRGKASPRSDIYAFGGTLFFLLTAKDPEPFSQSNPMAGGAVVSSSLNDLIRLCTVVEPEKRIQDVEELKRELKLVDGRVEHVQVEQ